MSFLFWLICGIMGHGQLQGGSIIDYWSRTVTGSWLSEMCHFHGISLVQFSHSVVFDSLQPHGLQHARPPCPSPTPRAHSNSCLLGRWCYPTISSCHSLLRLPSIFPSIRVFSKESVLHIRWPKYWSFSFSISPSNGHPGLISFRMDWLDLLAVQGTLKSLLQHHSSKASTLQCSAFFIVQLSHPYMTTGKTMVVLFLAFLETSILFFVSTVSIYSPTNSARRFSSLHILSRICL